MISYNDFTYAMRDVRRLIELAREASNPMLLTSTVNQEEYALFLRLALVLIATNLQVFIENILREFLDNLKRKNSRCISRRLILNSLRIYFNNKDFCVKFQEKLKRAESEEILSGNDLLNFITGLNKHFNNNIEASFIEMDVRYKIGKGGTEEIKKLFRQITTERDIFNICDTDSHRIDEILHKRHIAIHEGNVNLQLTCELLHTYESTILSFCERISNFLESELTSRD